MQYVQWRESSRTRNLVRKRVIRWCWHQVDDSLRTKLTFKAQVLLFPKLAGFQISRDPKGSLRWSHSDKVEKETFPRVQNHCPKSICQHQIMKRAQILISSHAPLSKSGRKMVKEKQGKTVTTHQKMLNPTFFFLYESEPELPNLSTK